MININKDYLISHKCYKGQNKPEYITIHETDNIESGAGAIRHGQAHYNGNLGDASVHFFVDYKNIVQTLNYNDGAWALGVLYGKPKVPQCTNYNSINIEMCVNPESSYDTTWYNTVDLVRYLMNELNIPSNKVITHYDACVKWCPRITLDNKWWSNFMDYINNPSKQTPTSPKNDNLPSDFDYIKYLQLNGDVLSCVCSGGFNSGCNENLVRAAAERHYREYGPKEKRLYK